MTNKSDLGGSDLHDLTIHTPDIPLNNVGCHDENELLYEALFELTSILGELYALELYIDILTSSQDLRKSTIIHLKYTMQKK